MADKNYVLGRGRILVAAVDPSTKNPGPYRYVGITREFNITAETEDLEHTSSDAGVNEVDERIQLSVTRTGTLTLEDIEPENLALFFFGSARTIAGRSGDNVDRTVVIQGTQLQQILADGYDDDNQIFLGATAANPLGIREFKGNNFSLAGLKQDGSTVVALAAGTDYVVVDNDLGTFRLLDTAKTYRAAGADVLSRITATYRNAAFREHTRVVSGGTPFEGAIRFEEANPKGRNANWTFPLVNISPNGDLALKAEEWRQIPLSLSIQKPANAEAIYHNGVPA